MLLMDMFPPADRRRTVALLLLSLLLFVGILVLAIVFGVSINDTDTVPDCSEVDYIITNGMLHA